MSEVRRRRFDKEFKLEAVRLVVEEGKKAHAITHISLLCMLTGRH